MEDNYKFDKIDIIPVGNRLVVELSDPLTFKQEQRVMDDEANEGKDPLEDDMATKLIEVDVKYNYQLANIVGIPKDNSDFKVGDLILADFRNAKKIDSYKDCYWVYISDIIGKKAIS